MAEDVFNTGDSVKVKAGVVCPDDESVCLGGWQGRIIDIDDGNDGEPIVTVEWDGPTLKNIPLQYIADSEEEGLDWSEMSLCASEVQAAAPRESAADTAAFRERWAAKFCWLGEGKQGKRIFKVIAEIDNDNAIEAWVARLKQVLTFPFEAEVAEPQERGPLSYGEKVQVHELCDADDHYGILVNVSRGNKHVAFPLCDLTAVGKTSPNCTPVADYCVWFANR